MYSVISTYIKRRSNKVRPICGVSDWLWVIIHVTSLCYQCKLFSRNQANLNYSKSIVVLFGTQQNILASRLAGYEQMKQKPIDILSANYLIAMNSKQPI